MKKYIVTKISSVDSWCQIVADSKKEAIQLAQEYGAWIENFSDFETTFEAKLDD